MVAAPVRPRALWLVALLLTSLLVLMLLPSRPAHAAVAPPERSFRYLMNGERAKRARPRLRMNRRLVNVARTQSREMASSGAIYHNPDLASDLSGVSWSVAGENVGVGNSVESLHQAFMDSAGHRKNVLRRSFRKVGVGVVAADGRIWVTVVFAG